MTAASAHRPSGPGYLGAVLVCVTTLLVLLGCSPPPIEYDGTASVDSSVTGAMISQSTLNEVGDVQGAIAIIGDSFATGYGLGGDESAFPELLGSLLCRPVATSAEDGTGYVKPRTGQDGYENYPSRYGAILDSGLAAVVVQGSDNDSHHRGTEITAAAEVTFDSLQAALPGVPILAVGPVAVPALHLSRLLRIRDALFSAADRTGVTFLDPIQNRWLQSPESFLDDDEHPTPQGHAEIADNIRNELATLNVLSECP